MLRVVVLISGTGSNLRALHSAIGAGRCQAEVVAVVSDRAKAEGLAWAKGEGLATQTVRMRDHVDRQAWDAALAEAVASHAPDLVVLAGFMKIVGEAFVARFPHRAINVHPSLLPAFPGTDAPAQALQAGVRLSGCTVHLVDSGVDTGPILAQAAVRVAADDTAESLHRRIQRLEHQLLHQVVDGVARGELSLGPAPRWRDQEADDSAFVAPKNLA